MKRQLISNLTPTSKRRLFVAALIVGLNLITVHSTKAQDSPCGSDIITETVTYFPISGSLTTNALDSRVTPLDTSYRVKLVGSLHYQNPSGRVLRNRPVLIFNHGHEQARPSACTLVKYFTDQGWLVFAPLRRGYYLDENQSQTLDPGEPRSTGIYIDDFVDACDRTRDQAVSSDYLPHLYCGSGFCRASLECGASNRRSGVELFYLNQQRIDVREAIDYIKSRPAISSEKVNPNWKLADAKRIAIMGHSYGGGVTIFANAFDYGQSVAIDVAGAELSWGNPIDPYWSSDLIDAIVEQKRPVYMFQAKNGKYIQPTQVLFFLAAGQAFRSQAALFPASACDARNADGSETFPPCDETSKTEEKQIHGNFIGHPEQVATWGPSVVEFMKRYPRN